MGAPEEPPMPEGWVTHRLALFRVKGLKLVNPDSGSSHG